MVTPSPARSQIDQQVSAILATIDALPQRCDLPARERIVRYGLLLAKLEELRAAKWPVEKQTPPASLQ